MALNGYSYYYAEKLQNYGMSKDETPWTRPTTYYVGIGTSATVPEPDGDNFTEPPYTPAPEAYGRVATTPATDWAAAVVWPSGTDAIIKNLVQITFPTSGPGGWGIIRYFAVFDNAGPSTQVYMMWGGKLEADKNIEESTVAVFLIGDLSVSSVNSPMP